MPAAAFQVSPGPSPARSPQGLPSGLVSPANGSALRADAAHSLCDETGARWPVVDGIPYLRVGREAVVAEVLALLDRGRTEDALVLLLAEQDDWWTGSRADPAALRRLARERDRLTLREAVALLGWGRVGDYFLHRWSDPTFLAGLALLEAHWTPHGRVFELACGIGHFLRELQLRGCEVLGGDVVFAKLWVARHWVLERDAALVCFDAGAGWPIAAEKFDLAMCHDAFYFLEPKAEIAAALRRIAGAEGWVAVGHIHNAEQPGFSAGHAMTAQEVEALFPDALVYDDAELTRALAQARAPVPQPASELKQVEAFSLAFGPGLCAAPRPITGTLALPPPGRPLRRNPLYSSKPNLRAELIWPSGRYEEEYGPRATYPARSAAPERAVMSAAVEPLARRRELVDLPERW